MLGARGGRGESTRELWVSVRSLARLREHRPRPCRPGKRKEAGVLSRSRPPSAMSSLASSAASLAPPWAFTFEDRRFHVSSSTSQLATMVLAEGSSILAVMNSLTVMSSSSVRDTVLLNLSTSCVWSCTMVGREGRHSTTSPCLRKRSSVGAWSA